MAWLVGFLLGWVLLAVVLAPLTGRFIRGSAELAEAAEAPTRTRRAA